MDCKNCKTVLDDSQNFCYNCGAKVIRNRLKLKVLINQVNEEFLSVDNRLLKTFFHLFTKPGVVINSYINGIRKRYIDVIQYFAIALTFLGLQVFLMKYVFNDPELYRLEFLEGIANMPNQKNNPFLNGSKSNDDFNSLQSLFFTISIPVSAFATWLSYFITGIRRYNFTEHIVINLYYGSQVTIVSSLVYIILLGFGVNFFAISIFTFFIFYIYFFFTLKRVFNTRFWTTFANFLLSLVILFGLFLFIMIIVSIVVYLFMIKN